MPATKHRAEDRLETFFRALAFQLPGVSEAAQHAVLRGALPDPLSLPTDDRLLLRLASLTSAYFREVRGALNGRVELDVREEAILEAALEYLREKA